MERRYRDGDEDFKPNTRTYTSGKTNFIFARTLYRSALTRRYVSRSVIDAWAKSGEKGAARRADQILNAMQQNYERTGDPDVRPNVHSANAVCNVSNNLNMDVMSFHLSLI